MRELGFVSVVAELFEFSVPSVKFSVKYRTEMCSRS